MTTISTPEEQRKRLLKLKGITIRFDSKWHRLDNETGDGDFTPADTGMHQSDNSHE
jgi:hypothetical protein